MAHISVSMHAFSGYVCTCCLNRRTMSSVFINCFNLSTIRSFCTNKCAVCIFSRLKWVEKNSPRDGRFTTFVCQDEVADWPPTSSFWETSNPQAAITQWRLKRCWLKCLNIWLALPSICNFKLLFCIEFKLYSI